MNKGLLAEDHTPAAPVAAAPVAVPVALPVAAPVQAAAVPGGTPQTFESDAPPVLSGQTTVEGKIMRSVATDRKYSDVHWGIIFVVALLVALASGYSTFSIVTNHGADLNKCIKHLDMSKVPQDYKQKLSGDSAQVPLDLHQLCSVLVVGAIGAFAAGAAFIVVIEKEARIITWLSVSCMPLLCILSGLSSLKAAQADTDSGHTGHNGDCMMGDCTTNAYYCFGVALFLGLVIMCIRAQVELTAEILRMSATAFKENTGLIWTTGGTSLVITLGIVMPLSIFAEVTSSPKHTIELMTGCIGCFSAPQHSSSADASQDQPDGYYAPPPAPSDDFPDGAAQGFKGALEKQCSDQTEAIGWIYGNDGDLVENQSSVMPLLWFMLIWVGMLAMEIRVCNVGATIGMHYFEQATPDGGSRAMTALKWSLTTSFGSLCYSSLILTLVKIMEFIVEHVQRQARESDNLAAKIAAEIIGCLWNCLQRWIEFLTKMAVIGCAISGDPFCTSVKSTWNMLKRRGWESLNVDTMTGFTLLMLSLAMGTVFGYGTYYAMGKQVIAGWVMGIMAFAICQMVSGIVLVIANTHYFCYVLDLDHAYAPAARTQAIHELYSRAIAGAMTRRKGEAGAGNSADAGGYKGAQNVAPARA